MVSTLGLVYVEFPLMTSVCGNVLTQQWLVCKMSIASKPCSPHRPCIQWTHLFPVPLPSIHEWLWFRLFWHKILNQSSHRRVVEITTKRRRFEHIMVVFNYIMQFKNVPLGLIKHTIYKMHSINLLVSFPESQTSKQTSKGSGMFLMLLS